MIYEIQLHGENYNVVLEKEEYEIYITVEGIIGRSLFVAGKSAKEAQRKGQIAVTYEEMRIYFPEKVISSVFSLHGEYPSRRPVNYIGDEKVKIFNIAELYGINHYNFNSLSKGISRFIKMFEVNKESLNSFLKLLNITFENTVRIHEFWRKDVYNKNFIYSFGN